MRNIIIDLQNSDTRKIQLTITIAINYPSKIGDWKSLRNNPTIALNIVSIKEKEILQAYISKHYPNQEK